MEVTYNLEPNDLVRFNRFWWRRKSNLKSWLFMLGALTLVFVFYASALVSMSRLFAWHTGHWLLLLWFVLMLIFFPLFLLIFYPLLVRRRARATPGFVGLHTLAINPEGLTHRTNLSETNVQWESVVDITEDEALIYIFLSAFFALMIPKGGFAGPDAAQEYVNTAKQFWKNPGQQVTPSADSSLWPPPPQMLKP